MLPNFADNDYFMVAWSLSIEEFFYLIFPIYLIIFNKIEPYKLTMYFIIFLIAAKAKGVSYFKNLSELNQKESPRLKWGNNILNKMGVKTIMTKDSIKIYGNPNLKINKKIIIKDYLKDHRVFMTSVIAALSFGGEWNIHNKDSIKTSFPNFLKIIKEIKN